YLEQHILTVIPAVSGIPAVEVSIIFRSHISPTSPAFVANAPIFYIPGLVPAIGPPQVSHRTFTVRIDIFHPFGHFFNGPATHIRADVRLGTDKVAKVQKFMGTKTVVFRHATPIGIYDLRPSGRIADTIHPMILVSKTSARPAKVGNLYVL